MFSKMSLLPVLYVSLVFVLTDVADLVTGQRNGFIFDVS
jgi:hypothetical protein